MPSLSNPFSKSKSQSPSKKPAKEDPASNGSYFGLPSPRNQSPTKKPSSASARREISKKEFRPASSRSNSAKHHSSREQPTTHTSRRNRDSNSDRHDRNSHPLNLPLDELRRRTSAMEDSRSSMEVDKDEAVVSSEPSSPAPQTPVHQTNGTKNSFESEKSPTPPPHRSMPAQPAKPAVDAEACKAAGNKYFKTKDYNRAIQEYTKGQ